MADPSSFYYLTSVSYVPSNSGNHPCATQVVINDASGAAIATNVAAVEFVFNCPSSGSEAGAAGYTTITVEGTAASSVATRAYSITTTNEYGPSLFTPTWTAESPDLIAGLNPSTATGNFNKDGNEGDTNVLPDQMIGISGTPSTFATCGASAGTTLIYTLTNSANGSDVTNIVVYTGWPDSGRMGQYYNLSFSTVSAPTTFNPICTIFYLPRGGAGNGNAQANRVAIFNSTGAPLGSNVASLKFDFAGLTGASSFNNGYQGYSEIIVQGTNSAPPGHGLSPYLIQDTLPTYAETVVGDQVVFTAAYSNTPPAALQWQVIKSGVTNNINTGAANVTNSGVVTSTLTLNNVQVSDSGTYLLKATNSADSTALASFSTPAPLAVSNSPAPVNNIIINFAGQMFPSSATSFFPAWPVNTNGDLIFGFTNGSGPGTVVGVGDFTGGGNYCNADPTVLSDGIAANITSLPNLTYCAGGTHTSGAGESVTYSLVTNSAPYGLDLTNITVFGGWQDAGRDEQKYQVLYSTVQAPASFAPLVTADYVPTDSANSPVVSRTTLLPAAGALVHNVAAVRINFNLSPAPKNFWEGYCEIVIGGTNSAGFVPPLTNDIAPSTASDVVGGQIVMTAGFSGYTSLQWKKNGTNFPGATTSTLTLNNLQLTDAGTYSLVASNAIGVNSSGLCTLTVNPAPIATNNIITAIATQTSVLNVFTPTWDTNGLSSSLIYNVPPSSSGEGDFTGGSFTPGGPTGGSLPAVLTDGTFGTIDFNETGTHSWVTCMGFGSVDGLGNLRSGQYVIYTLPASANGYNITNIMIAGGWNDGGRDQQAYTVNYATSANPTYFTPLLMVNYEPNNPVGYLMDRATITSASGVLVSNVVALDFDMTTPPGENGFSGYSEIAVFGSPSATPPPAGPLISVQHEETNFDWTVETPNLIANQLPSSSGPGSFTLEGCTEAGLTDGVLAFGGGPNSASCGADPSAVPWIIFSSADGWNLTNIVVYALWHDYGRDGQYYNLSYSTLSAPSTFLPLASVDYDSPTPHNGVASGNRVAISPPVGQTMLASNVAAVKFDFTPQGTQDFGWSGYTEIILQGTLTLPTMAPPKVSAGNLILTGTGSPPNAGYTLLTATNVTIPLANWTVSVTGTLDSSGAFSNAIPINVTNPASFFRFRMP